MSKLKYLTLSILLALLLAGCGSRRPCTLDDYDDFDIILDDPAHGSMLTTVLPTLDWHHSESCRPENYYIQVQMKEKNGVWGYLVDGDSTEYHLDTYLQTGGEYYWTVRPYASSVEYHGKSSPEWIFYTGLPCTSRPTRAPVPVFGFRDYDRLGEWISPSDAYRFEWYYPGNCLPDGYYYEFAEDWRFESILASGETSDYQMFVELEFPDCTSGYWRVAAGTRSSHGPFSEVRRFFWATDDSCWMLHVPSPEMTLIQGRVYEDYCPNTTFFTSSRSLHDGCVSTPGIGVHADGLDRPWEPGIENVQVDLRSGYCPTPDEMAVTIFPDTPTRETVVTDHNGKFEFMVLNPGVYCLSISKDQEGAPILTSGLWTEPLTESNFAYKSIEIPASTYRIFEDFGWDPYDHPTVYMEHITHCRGGDSKAFPSAAMIENEFVPLLARNPDATWLKTRVDGVDCYFYSPEKPECFTRSESERDSDPDQTSDNEKPEEECDVLDLPIFDSPPRPLPSPTPTKKPSKPGVVDKCSAFKDFNSCVGAGCTWNPSTQQCEK